MINDVTYSITEHFMGAEKAHIFGVEEIRKPILGAFGLDGAKIWGNNSFLNQISKPMTDNTNLLQHVFSQDLIALENAPFLKIPSPVRPEDWGFARVEGMLFGLAIGGCIVVHTSPYGCRTQTGTAYNVGIHRNYSTGVNNPA